VSRDALRALCLIGPVLLAISCSVPWGGKEEVIARCGDLDLTKPRFEAIAGVPFDSMTFGERWSIVNHWAETAMLRQEGVRRGLEEDPSVQAHLDQLRSEIYLSRMLRTEQAPVISDEEVERYYAEHGAEFLQMDDSYLIECFRADDQETLDQFRPQFTTGDSTLLIEGRVAREGTWLLGRQALHNAGLSEISELHPGEWSELRQDEAGWSTIHLLHLYEAGSTPGLEAVDEQIRTQLMIARSHRAQEELMSDLRRRYPVAIFLEDSL